jgi:RimJ/RimL family protein N-acetyltransferase
LLQRKDFDTWIRLFHEPEVGGFLGMQHINSPREQCEEWFRRQEERYEKGLGGMNVLIHKTTNEMIGQCGLLVQQVDGLTELEVAYSILPQHWRMGFASEAAQKCRDYAFENRFSDSLVSIIHVDNIKSEKVVVKNGMSLSKATTFLGMPVNVFRIKRTEWERIRKG